MVASRFHGGILFRPPALRGNTGFTNSLYTKDTSLSGWGKLTGQVIGVPGSSTNSQTYSYNVRSGSDKSKPAMEAKCNHGGF